VILARAKGPFHIDFQGGFAWRGGEAEHRTDDNTVEEGAIPAEAYCGGTGEDDTVEWCSSAMPRSSHSESESES
jgi:hypothetical protein